jgi:hypothetical protein
VRTIVRDVESIYKVIIFYEVGLPRVFDIPGDEEPKKFIRTVTKSLSVSVQLLGWALIDPKGKRVIRSEGLSDKMYEEMDSLLGLKMEREPGDVYKEGEEEEGLPLGKTRSLPLHEIRTHIYREGKREG